MASIIDQSGFEAYNSERTGLLDPQLLDPTVEEAMAQTEATDGWASTTTSTYDKVKSVSSQQTTENLLSQYAGTDTSEETSTFQDAMSALSSLSSSGGGGSGILTVIKEVLGLINSTVFYDDGISETAFGADMETSWINFFSWARSGPYTTIVTDTPLGSKNASAVYGNLILGTPPLFTSTTDPNNRVTLNTFVKDFRFLALTPGMPKFNGVYIFARKYVHTPIFK